MTELICNLENKDISDEEFNGIECKCKKQKHISDHEKLRNLIYSDPKLLEDLHIDINTIKDFLEKIKLHFDLSSNSISSNPYSDVINKVFSKFNTNGWSCWGMLLVTQILYISLHFCLCFQFLTKIENIFI